MHNPIPGTPHMSEADIELNFPDQYVLVRLDSAISEMGHALFVGDSEDELLDLIDDLEPRGIHEVIEGANKQRSLGGIFQNG